MHRDPHTDKPNREEERRLDEEGRIRHRLTVAQLALSRIDELYQLPPGTSSNTLKEPHIAGERAIAAALGTHAHLLWRTRYRADGRRLEPQPSWNYRNGRRSAQKEAA